MAENESSKPSPASGEPLALWLLRLAWPLPGALSGAYLGFHLYFRQPGLNTDTFAPLFLAGLWAVGGMLSGALCSVIAGGLLELALRRMLPARPLLAGSLAIVCLIGLCLALPGPLVARLPGLLWPAQQAAASPLLPPSQPSPCTQAPPVDGAARKAWELECR